MFGSKKLPDTARALGQSLRVLRSEAEATKDEAGRGGRSAARYRCRERHGERHGNRRRERHGERASEPGADGDRPGRAFRDGKLKAPKDLKPSNAPKAAGPQGRRAAGSRRRRRPRSREAAKAGPALVPPGVLLRPFSRFFRSPGLPRAPGPPRSF
ncbi:twin-arginine translocase TatA/TatE family subunit [Streptomyces sp. NBC_00016]|uniref:twin-arginine translocase TatA/TatE family subunit n=1 Tax=Streptomyces sp. NBC_00016 TaxID=2975622 RepID=UPI0038691044